MPIRYVDSDEWYPVYLLRDKPRGRRDIPAAEFSAEELAAIERVEAEFHAWQKKIAIRFGFDRTVDEWPLEIEGET
jgi:hypothetical protein